MLSYILLWQQLKSRASIVLEGGILQIKPMIRQRMYHQTPTNSLFFSKSLISDESRLSCIEQTTKLAKCTFIQIRLGLITGKTEEVIQ